VRLPAPAGGALSGTSTCLADCSDIAGFCHAIACKTVKYTTVTGAIACLIRSFGSLLEMLSGAGHARRQAEQHIGDPGMTKGSSPLENEAAQSTTALGPLVGLAREDFVGAIALLLRETASDPARTMKHMRGFGEDMVKIMTGKSELAPDPKDKRFRDPAWQYNPFFRAGAQYYLAVQKGMKGWMEDLELDPPRCEDRCVGRAVSCPRRGRWDVGAEVPRARDVLD